MSSQKIMKGKHIYRKDRLVESPSGPDGTSGAMPRVRKTICMRSIVVSAVLAVIIVSLAGLPDASPGGAPALACASAEITITDADANVVVSTASYESFEAVLALARWEGIEVVFSDHASGIVSLSHEASAEPVLSLLASQEGVRSISSEKKARATFVPNDPSLNLQWGLDAVNAYEAWDITGGSHEVVVAILDTGIDWTHPDIAPNIWSDSDGYHGYNFIANNRIPMDDNVNSYDGNVWVPGTNTYHGTHVAGVVGAAMNNGIGVAGISQVRLMAVKVMNESGEGTDSTVASGIHWAVDHGAHIITMSLGVEGTSSVLSNAVADASESNVVMVAASGNSGSSLVSYPAAYPAVIAVGAVDNTLLRASFSNYGAGLDIMAPGVMIYSTQGGGAYYQNLAGTSTAAPFVAGVAALMLTMNPALTPVEIGLHINSTATDISRAGYDTMTGWGIVDAFSAVERVSDPTLTFVQYPEYAGYNSTFSISWMVSGGDPGVIETTYIRWGLDPLSLVNTSANFSGTTWAVFSANGVNAPGYNTTMYVRAYAIVDGVEYESILLEVPVREPVPDNILTQFLRDVQNFIFNDLGIYNFLLLVGFIIAIPAIALALRPKKRRVTTSYYSAPAQSTAAAPQTYLPPPPPPPPRFEAYVDLMGQDVMPKVLKVVEGTKVVWINRSWAPPPGISVRSGRFDSDGEHPDGVFQSGMLVAPGDYWSATFHRPGVYEYYLTGVWKTAKIIVEAYSPGGSYVATAG
jgi:subtilisin family serine protease